MATGFKTFDELYKEVIGTDPPEKKDMISDTKKDESVKMNHKKKAEVLSGSVKRKNKKKKLNERERELLKKKEARKAEKWRNDNRQKEQDIQKAEMQAAAEINRFKKSFKSLPSSIKCPTHGSNLQNGCIARFSNDDKDITLYFCNECNCLYYVANEPKSKKRIYTHGVEVKYINQDQIKKEAEKRSTNGKTEKSVRSGDQLTKNDEKKQEVQKRFDPASNTLYVHQGRVATFITRL